MMSRDKLYVDGGWVPSTGTETIAVENPATEEVLGHVPTVFADVDPAGELAQEEIFGPVLSIIAFEDDDEAVRIANNSRYSLAEFQQTKAIQR